MPVSTHRISLNLGDFRGLFRRYKVVVFGRNLPVHTRYIKTFEKTLLHVKNTVSFFAITGNCLIYRKMLHNQRETDVLLHLDASVVTSSGHDYEGTILLTGDTLFIVGSAVDAIQQTLFIRDIELQEDAEDSKNVSIVNQSVIAKEGDEEDGEAHADSCDSDRLRQFLRDARAQALEQMSSHDPSDSDSTCAGQKFVLVLDPVLRRTLLLQFHAAKRSCTLEP